MPYGRTPIGLSTRDNEPLQWCSAYIRSRHFSSSVKSLPLYDDHHHHSTAERTLTCVSITVTALWAQERLQSIYRSPGTVFPCVALYFNHRLTVVRVCFCRRWMRFCTTATLALSTSSPVTGCTHSEVVAVATMHNTQRQFNRPAPSSPNYTWPFTSRHVTTCFFLCRNA